MNLIETANSAMLRMIALVVGGVDAVRARASVGDPDGERGDVPGWVMITLMTAIVTIGLLAIFQDQVFAAVRTAFSSVNG